MNECISDAALLDRFVNHREEAAFVALVKRHGPLVLKVCRRILSDEHDIEDAFQATFLVLALKAAAISWDDSVGGWLHAVARRLALNTRNGASRRRNRERPMAALAASSYEGHLRPSLDEPYSWSDPLRRARAPR